MRRGNSLGLKVAVGCLLLQAPLAMARDAAPDVTGALPAIAITDRNGVALDAKTTPALAVLKSAGAQPVQLSLDAKADKILSDELAEGLERFSAKAAAGFIMDVNTGEIIALAAIESSTQQTAAPVERITQGVYEIGSSAKLMTVAMALEAGKADFTSRIDARELHYGKFTIHDADPQARALTLPEAVTHSSNIVAARLAQRVGTSGQKAFLEKMGQLDSLDIDGLDKVAPIFSKTWPGIYTLTAAFGHGMAVSPLQAGMAVAALVNGGTLRQPTLFKRNDQALEDLGRQVISSDTSAKMRYLVRLNAEQGTAQLANIAGYDVGGVTSTAEKVVNGQYARRRVITTFTAVLPADKPRYLVMTMLDEPQALRETYGFITAGWNATPIAAKVIERVAPILGVERRPTLPATSLPM
jgi:cell division protein FtsI (penicillin-binding protein 3)